MPAAINNTRLQNQDDEEGRFFRLISWQGRYNMSFSEAWDRRLDTEHRQNHQGLYAATAEGELLGYCGARTPDQLVAMLQQALEKWRGRRTQLKSVELEDLTERDESLRWEFPEGGLVLHVGISDLPRKVDHRPNDYRRHAHNVDYVWFLKDEMLSIVPRNVKVGMVFPFPDKLTRRLARYHLLDYVHGETDPWPATAVRAADLKLRVTKATAERVDMTLTGEALLCEKGIYEYDGKVQERGFDAKLLGYLSFDRKAKKFIRFDIVAVGTRWGATTHSGRGAADAVPGPMGIAMTIAGNEPRDRTPPHISQHRGSDRHYFER